MIGKRPAPCMSKTSSNEAGIRDGSASIRQADQRGLGFGKVKLSNRQIRSSGPEQGLLVFEVFDSFRFDYVVLGRLVGLSGNILLRLSNFI